MRESSEGIFDIEGKAARLAGIEREMSGPDFWNDHEKAQKLVKEKSSLDKIIIKLGRIEKGSREQSELYELARTESDGSLEKDIESSVSDLEAEVQRFELENLFADEMDEHNAILAINSGAGGTEAQDWAEMLMRMYLRWCEKRHYAVQEIDIQPGEGAGMKSATLEVTGEYAFGYLKAEMGIHRLVRISPFDANHRRHTSFASVFVYPEIDDDIEVEVREEDLRIDTYRASGAGGQHVNKTSSAVRITHLPSGIVVQCQNERSQHKNKAWCMKVLKAKLYELEKEKRNEEVDKLHAQKKEITWGSQIRSYVLHPYKLVKDHRTGVEVGNAEAVLDGEIDKFIDSFLKGTEAK
jgi:peptide chain release factor 2